MDATQIIAILAPIIVYLVTLLINKLTTVIPGWVIVGLIVPLLSAALGWIATLIVPDASWLSQFGVGLVAVFVNELLKQLKQIKNP